MVSLRQAVASGSTVVVFTWRWTPALSHKTHMKCPRYDRSPKGLNAKVAWIKYFYCSNSHLHLSSRNRTRAIRKSRKRIFLITRLQIQSTVQFRLTFTPLQLRNCTASHWNWQIHASDVLALLPVISDSSEGNLIMPYCRFNRACNVILLQRHCIENLMFSIWKFSSGKPQHKVSFLM